MTGIASGQKHKDEIMENIFQRFADYQNPKSIAYKLRRNRIKCFEEYVTVKFGQKNRITIVDLGGTEIFWRVLNPNFLNKADITLVNLEEVQTTLPNITSIVGDARSLNMFTNKQFDIAFSNSVIEHVGGLTDQQDMANEIQRIADFYYIQTPNKYFFLEPHFIFPFFSFIPTTLKIFLIRHWDIGQFAKVNNYEDAVKIINSINLLDINKVKTIFPTSRISFEYFGGMKKSIIISK